MREIDLRTIARTIARDRPVLIAGPTASGKSALAAAIADHGGGVIVNADALQVFGGWRLLTARPDAAETAARPHALYGHVAFDAPYSTGDWLREAVPLLTGPARPIIVGGTGLNFLALTAGLAPIPPVPPAVRARADAMALADLVAGLDPRSAGGIDLANRARVQRAWEVLKATGRGIADWQAETPAPALPPALATRLLVMPGRADLEARIADRFDAMLAQGLLDEARAMRPAWNPRLLSSRAIGAAELMAHLDGRIALAEARAAAILQTRQFAKRQRTWCRARMRDWTVLSG